MIIRCHVCIADPAARWKSPPAMIFHEGRQRPRRPVDTYRDHLSPKREEEIQEAGGRRESCDELSTRTQGNHRLVRHPEDGSAYPQRLLAHACANAACANQPSIRLVVTEQEGSDIRPRSFGVRPSYDDELGAVEAFGLDPGASWRRTGLSAIRPGLFPCMRRAPHWKRRWAYSS